MLLTDSVGVAQFLAYPQLGMLYHGGPNFLLEPQFDSLAPMT